MIKARRCRGIADVSGLGDGELDYYHLIISTCHGTCCTIIETEHLSLSLDLFQSFQLLHWLYSRC